jgi:predicted nuclease with TOPRIM domain
MNTQQEKAWLQPPELTGRKREISLEIDRLEEKLEDAYDVVYDLENQIKELMKEYNND